MPPGIVDFFFVLLFLKDQQPSPTSYPPLSPGVFHIGFGKQPHSGHLGIPPFPPVPVPKLNWVWRLKSFLMQGSWGREGRLQVEGPGRSISRGPGRGPSPSWRPHPAQSSTVSKTEPPGVPNHSSQLMHTSLKPIIIRNLNHRCPSECQAAFFGAISLQQPLSCTTSFLQSHCVP